MGKYYLPTLQRGQMPAFQSKEDFTQQAMAETRHI